MTRLLSLLMLFVTAATSHQVLAQAGKLSFQTEAHNFGRVYKNNTPIQHSFSFTNTGSAPVSVVNVVSDCSCATPSFTVDPVMPGEKGSIVITHDPYRAGPFEKNFVVTTNGQPRTYNLSIKGYIMPFSANASAAEYTHQNGDFRFRHKNLNLGTITTKATVSKKFQFFNSSQRDVVFTDKIISPPHIKVYFDSSHIVKAGSVGSIVITYNPQIKNDFGYFQESVLMYYDGNKPLDMTLTVNIEQEPAAELSPQLLAQAPKMRLSESAQNLGNVYSHLNVVTEFVIYNEGNGELKIHKIQADEGCEIISEQVATLAPNESRIVKVRFNPSGKSGKQDRIFTIYSNDPLNAKQTVEIKANVLTE